MTGNVPSYSLIKFRSYVHDTRGPELPQREVLATQEELDAYLATCDASEIPHRPVQYPGECAIAVALGQRPTLGYEIDIVAIVQEVGGFVGVQHHVLYVEKAPYGPAGDMVTRPQHVVTARGIGGVVIFHAIPDQLGDALRGLFGQRAAPASSPSVTRGVQPPQLPSMTTLMIGEEHPTMVFGEHVTSFLFGEEHPTTFRFGEESPTGIIAEHPTTLPSPTEDPITMRFGEGPVSDPRVEDPFGGQGGSGSFG